VEHYPAQDVLLVGERRAIVPMVRASKRPRSARTIVAMTG